MKKLNIELSAWMLVGLFFGAMISAFADAVDSTEADERTTFRVMTYNIHHARGLDDVVDADRIAAVLKDSEADFIGLQEVDRFVERSHRLDLVQEISRSSGLQYSVFGKNIDHQGGDYGNAILSRYPVAESYNHHLTMLHEGEQRSVLWAKILTPKGSLWLGTTHIDYRRGNEERLSNVREFLKVAKEKQQNEPNIPMILLGDFNDFPEGEVHQLMKTGFQDSWEIVGNGDGFTFSSEAPRSRIDYIYLRKGDALKPVKMEIPKTRASDHSPLWLEFSW